MQIGNSLGGMTVKRVLFNIVMKVHFLDHPMLGVVDGLLTCRADVRGDPTIF